jgi:hypothetical protein
MHCGMRRAIASVTIGVAVAVGSLTACGGGASTSTPTTTVPPDPGASIDPDGNGVLTGPVNAAKRTSDAQDQRTQQLEGKIAGTP